jgi:hypothetical protein
MFVNYGDTVAEMRCQGLPVQDTLTLLKLDPFSANFLDHFLSNYCLGLVGPNAICVPAASIYVLLLWAI